VRSKTQNRLVVDGKFFLLDGERVFLRLVTYGPFPDPQPDHAQELRRVREAGFHGVRVYTPPSERFLDEAAAVDLVVFLGVPWQWGRDFLGESHSYYSEAAVMLTQVIKQCKNHSAVVGLFIANEIPADVARWMGPVAVRKALDTLILECRDEAPHLLYAYSSYPSSEYLEPAVADFTALNVYLEEREQLADYMGHLHHVAGDRPVMIAEFGLDSARNGTEKQADVLRWQLEVMYGAGVAGATVFAWSDRWQNGQVVVGDWDFGLVDREGRDKPALKSVKEVAEIEPRDDYPMISVVICTYNGAGRIEACVRSLLEVDYPNYEVIVVDDGSSDGTPDIVSEYLYDSKLELLQAPHGGLSRARNIGAEYAKGDIIAYTDDDCEADREWLTWLERGFRELDCDLCGGPNLPPKPLDEDEAVVAASPGAPTHVMLSDRQAEHLPGCNIAFTREAFERLGGFRVQYVTAGDDVNICWRAEELGMKIGFHGAAFVWHRRRTSFLRYFKQQWGYGKAEAQLMKDHPEKFTAPGGANWQGVIYGGGAMSVRAGDVIYSGLMGMAGYQHMEAHMMPSRPLHRSFATWWAEGKLRLAKAIHPWVRGWSRWWFSRGHRPYRYTLAALVKQLKTSSVAKLEEVQELQQAAQSSEVRVLLLQRLKSSGWEAYMGGGMWDLERDGVRVLCMVENCGGGAWMLRIRAAGADSCLFDELRRVSLDICGEST